MLAIYTAKHTCREDSYSYNKTVFILFFFEQDKKTVASTVILNLYEEGGVIRSN